MLKTYSVESRRGDQSSMEVNEPLILFDGVCNFCNGTVNFIIRMDNKKKIRFSTLQSEVAQSLLKKFDSEFHNFDFIVLIENDRFYIKSTAIFKVLRHLGGLWSLLYAFMIIPRPLRDLFYDLIANNRYKWFCKREVCMVPTEDVRERFID